MQNADESDGKSIHVGNFLTTSKSKYLIVEELGKGGYGSVFRVTPEPPDGNSYALKLELKLATREHAKLGMELHIMKAIGLMEPEKRTHFIDIHDRAKKTHFFFIVMTLVGPSLSDLKRERVPPIFTAGTVYRLAIQTLEAIQQFHDMGYVHRDIKPGNYAIGLLADKNIYLLDFGIARKVMKDTKEIKAPREKVGFKGTLRYASLKCHEGAELGMRDDCESWLYLLADISNPDGLPWKGEKDRHKVAFIKTRTRTREGAMRTFKGLDIGCMTDLIQYFDKLMYCDPVDYVFCYDQIKKAAQNSNVDMNQCYDWEDPMTKSNSIVKAPVSPKSKRSSLTNTQMTHRTQRSKTQDNRTRSQDNSVNKVSNKSQDNSANKVSKIQESSVIKK